MLFLKWATFSLFTPMPRYRGTGQETVAQANPFTDKREIFSIVYATNKLVRCSVLPWADSSVWNSSTTRIEEESSRGQESRRKESIRDHGRSKSPERLELKEGHAGWWDRKIWMQEGWTVKEGLQAEASPWLNEPYTKLTVGKNFNDCEEVWNVVGPDSGNHFCRAVFIPLSSHCFPFLCLQSITVANK